MKQERITCKKERISEGVYSKCKNLGRITGYMLGHGRESSGSRVGPGWVLAWTFNEGDVDPE